MNLPYRFPSQAEVVRQQAEAFRQLTPTERFLAIVDLMASGLTLMAQSPHQQQAREMRARQEAEWQQRMKEFFTQHAGRHQEPAASID